MSTNNIDSNKCEEKAELCGVAEVSEQADEVCASCGIVEVDNVKLKKCTCELVKYCSDGCREDHLELHEEECKKRVNALRDKKLFTQPGSSCFGECPLCFLPLPLEQKKVFYSCCSKKICDGCEYAHHINNKQNNCPFCREASPKDKEECKRRTMKRVEAGDPVALHEMGSYCYEEGDYDGAVKYWTKAVELGDVEAHYHLGIAYKNGEGVDKDERKAVYHYEKAAIGGDHYARHNLGCYEGRNGRVDRAVKHFIIAAKLGNIHSMKQLWQYYAHGDINKENLEATLRTHQAAIDAMKSPQREAAQAYYGD